MRSLQQDLNRWIMVFCVIFALLAGTASGVTVFQEAQELQDVQLAQIGQLLSHGQAILPDKMHLEQLHGDDREEKVIVQPLNNEPLARGQLPIPVNLADGLYSLNLRHTDWRLLVLTTAEGKRYAIAQDEHLRDELALGSTISTVLPLLLLAPLLMLVVHFIIAYSFRPVRELITRVDQRKETDLTPLTSSNIPREINPFIHSINQLLQRSGQMLTQQRRFVADAAHELRTPLTALSLLTENLGRAHDMAAVQERLIPLQESMQRMQTLVNQLLDLARIQGTHPAELHSVAFRPIVQQAIADLYPLAEAKQIDLGINRNENPRLNDQADSLKLLVHNALGNAIKYTPPGGKIDIDLFMENNEALFRVRDSGTGIPADELERVFEPFHRAQGTLEPGNGLGLTISLEIAQQLDGHISLQNRPDGGLEYCYHQALINTATNTAPTAQSLPQPAQGEH